MNEDRKQIDAIDKKLMSLLEERFKLVKKIGQFKQEQNLPIENIAREEEILLQAKKYLYEEEITNVYQQIFLLSKNIQKYKYALIGKSLPYTLSPQIYEALGLSSYAIIETDDFFKTLKKYPYHGFNVTIPYKELAYNYCNKHDESSLKTNVVNTIIDDKGYNTDYLALNYLFNKEKINHKKVLIIGNGATSRSVRAALNGNVINLVRTVRTEGEIPLSDYDKHLNAEVIINTTPYGTYPHLVKEPLFPLDKFTNLQLVVEVVYNPLNTPLIQEAKKLQIKTLNGFKLLVTQACLAYNLFTGLKANSDALYQKLYEDNLNIVLIGMPYAGKSHIAANLAKVLKKEVIDFDLELKKQGKDLETVLKTDSLASFRKFELDFASSLINTRGKIIAPGGGIVLSSEAMFYLSLNSVIVFINSPLSILKARFDKTRPLIKKRKDFDKLYKQRLELYKQYADIIVTKEEEIMEKIYAYIRN